VDILKQAAKSWLKISEYSYVITYGKSQKLHTIEIVFDRLDFYHLAGFQYLQDLKLPTVPQSKIIGAILDNKINGEYIKKGKKYFALVESRLSALINLEYSLDNDFRMFKYRPDVYPFYTAITTAEYLIEGKTPDNSLFFFTIKSDKVYNGMSIFMKDKNKDFSFNQKSLSILKKEKINLVTSNRFVLFDKLLNQKPQI